MKIAILASGSGTNAQAIIDKAAAGTLNASVACVISNKKDAGALARARAAGIDAEYIDPAAHENRAQYDRALLEAVIAHKADCVALAGYMLLLTPEFLAGFSGPILNIHPSLLPSFPGLRGVADAYAYGVKISGVSVHFVTEEMDRGPLIIQAAVPLPAERDMEGILSSIHAVEHRIYPQALQWVAEGRVRVDGRRTFLAPGRASLAPADPSFMAWPPLESGF